MNLVENFEEMHYLGLQKEMDTPIVQLFFVYINVQSILLPRVLLYFAEVSKNVLLKHQENM